jgi:hypothetical protein
MTVQAETQLTDLQRTPLRVMIVDDAASTRRFLTAVIQSAAVFDLLDRRGRAHSRCLYRPAPTPQVRQLMGEPRFAREFQSSMHQKSSRRCQTTIK